MTCDVAVVIASTGRPQLLDALLQDLERQHQLPSEVCLAVAQQTDLPHRRELPFEVRELLTEPGLTRQRNAGIEALERSPDVVAFLDDDLVISTTYIHEVARFFSTHLDVAGASGRLLADGASAKTPIGRAAASQALYHHVLEGPAPRYQRSTVVPLNRLYGCNMFVRRELLTHVRFDERLPLYGWLEDLDFSRRLLPHGKLARIDEAVAIHIGARSGGRTQHLRFGYAQIVNPLYLRSRGTVRNFELARLVVAPVLKNVLSFANPDRRTRARGNFFALLDIARKVSDPERMVALSHRASIQSWIRDEGRLV